MSEELVVTRWSAVNALGETARSAALCYRAGQSGLRECPILDGAGETVTLGSVPLLPPECEGVERLFALGRLCLVELLPRAVDQLSQGRTKLCVLLDEELARPLPDGRSAPEPLAAQLRSWLEESLGQRLAVEVDAGGAAGLGPLLERIRVELSEGLYEAALVVALHTDYDCVRIAALSAQDRIYSSENLDALLLGEGAAALVLSTERRAHALGLRPLAALGPAETTHEKARIDNDESAFAAAALTMATRRATQPLVQRGEKIGWLASDVSFEMFRTYELQATLVRNQSRLAEPQVLETPNQRLGFQGAVTGVWQIVYACEMFLRGGAPAARLLCLLGSEGGARTAFLIEAR